MVSSRFLVYKIPPHKDLSFKSKQTAKDSPVTLTVNRPRVTLCCLSTVSFSRLQVFLPSRGCSYFKLISIGRSSSYLIKVKVTQSCPTLCDPVDYTVHGILQARILEWVAFPFSRGPSQPRDRNQVSCIAGRFFTSWTIREAQEYWSG